MYTGLSVKEEGITQAIYICTFLVEKNIKDITKKSFDQNVKLSDEHV